MKRWRMVMLTAVVGGCAMVQSEHVLTGQAGPPYQGSVQVVMEGAPDPGAFEEVGIVSAHATLDPSLPAVIGALQREAAAIGGDAVIHVRYDRGADGATATGIAVKLAR